MGFWQEHGIWMGMVFLFCICVFPRLTLLFATTWGGPLWWVGWFFVPRLTVAILATTAYWNTNKILVILAWAFAFAGESGEKGIAAKKLTKRRRIPESIG